MKRITGIMLRLLLGTCLLQLSACSKIDIKSILHPQNKVPPVCKITRITSYTDPQVADFIYNRQGNPVAVTLQHVATGRPEFLFRYNKKHQLTDYIGAYRVNGVHYGYEFWLHYVYENDRIIRDTAYGLGTMVDDNPIADDAYQTSVTTYEYDDFGRITRAVNREVSSEEPFLVQTYTYNDEGNLIRYQFSDEGIVVYSNYDNKVNPHRTHEVWMFVDRDYSINNAGAAVTYNKFGLPLRTNYDIGINGGYQFLYQNTISESDIEYDCD